MIKKEEKKNCLTFKNFSFSRFFVYLLFSFILFYILLYYFISKTHTRLFFLSLFGIISLFVSIYSWKKAHHVLVSPYLFYLIICYLFMYGQSFLWAFALEAENDLRNMFQTEDILIAQTFTLLGLLFFHLGALYTTTRKEYIGLINNLKKKTSIYRNEINIVRIIGYLLLGIAVVPFVVTIIRKLNIAAAYGYSALYDANLMRNHSDAILDVLSLFIIPGIICLYISYIRDKIKRIVLVFIILLVILIYIFIGARFEGYSLALCLVLLWNLYLGKIKINNLVIIIFIIVILIQLIPVIRDYRNEPNKNILDIFELTKSGLTNITNFKKGISELGGSMFPLIATMQIVPMEFPYRYGKTYLYSIITLIPNLGFWDVHIGYAEANVNDWLQSALGLRYGPGYSMVAEAYINFGWFGIFFLFILGGFIGALLHFFDQKELRDRFIIYAIIMTFFYFSIITTRNSFVANIRALFLYALPIYIIATFLVNFRIYRSNHLVNND